MPTKNATPPDKRWLNQLKADAYDQFLSWSTQGLLLAELKLRGTDQSYADGLRENRLSEADARSLVLFATELQRLINKSLAMRSLVAAIAHVVAKEKRNGA